MKYRWTWKGIIVALGLVGLVWLVAGITQPPAHALPPQPALFWGSILMDGHNVPAGSLTYQLIGHLLWDWK